jgi:hypothetical protein
MKYYESKAWLYQKFLVERLNTFEIAKLAGCSHMTIERALKKFGLK